MQLRNVWTGLTIGLAVLASIPAGAQNLATATIRITAERADVLDRPTAGAEVIAVANKGTEFQTLQRDGDWYWVLLPPDTYGTRHVGWVQVPQNPAPSDVPSPKKAKEKKEKAQPQKPTPVKRTDDRKLRQAERELQKARAEYEAIVKRAGKRETGAAQSTDASPSPVSSPADAPSRASEASSTDASVQQ